MPLLAYGAPPFKSTLIPCGNWCGGFDDGPGGSFESFFEAGTAPEPATLEGQAGVGATGVLKVQVQGATANTTYEVYMADVNLGPVHLGNPLVTDNNGDGNVNNTLPAGTYISGVFLMRDTDFDSEFEPRIETGFVIGP
jgi:hypothetical protein